MQVGTDTEIEHASEADIESVAAGLRGRLKGLVFCLSHSWGGLEQVAVADSLEAGKLGIDMRVLCLEGSPTHEHVARQKNVRAVPLAFRPRDYFDFKLRAELYTHLADGVNLIHTHQPSLLGSITPWLWTRPEIAAMASRHILNNHNKKNPFHRAIYKRLDALVVMSQTLKRNVLATHPLRPTQVQVINLGLDFDRFDPARVDAKAQRARWGADADTLVVGLVGRIDPAKGQATFIRAAAGLSRNLKPNEKVKFVIVGEETLGRASNHLQELREMVAQFHLEDTVVFAGYQENIPEVMQAFDIFVMPSRQEAFGLVAIEAMAMETPIIISSGGSAYEIVGQEEFGLLVRPEDAFDLQHQIRWLMDHPEERAQMGKQARTHVMRNYDRKIRLFRTLELYQRALRRRGQI